MSVLLDSLSAGFSGSRRPLTDGQLLRAFVTHPLLTWKVTAGIHWEALKLWIKGVRLTRQPLPASEPFTIQHRARESRLGR